LGSMKPRRNKGKSLHDRFLSRCGLCGTAIGPDQEVFSASATLRPGIDLSSKEGQVIELRLRRAGSGISRRVRRCRRVFLGRLFCPVPV
jgi:hypothetical protein